MSDKDKIDNEINDLADKLIKSKKKETQEVDKNLIKSIIMDMTKEELKEAIPTLEKSEQELVFEVLTELKKAKAVEFDKDASPKVARPKLMDLRQEEDRIDATEDEKLVKEDAKDIDHQGDSTPEGKDGQIIKSEDLVDGKEESNEIKGTNDIDPEDEKKDLEKSDDVEKDIKDVAKKEAKEEVEEHEEKMHDKESDLVKKSEPSFGWESPDRLFKSNVLGRNYGLSVNEYYDAALKSSESLQKSTPVESEPNQTKIDYNDLIEKSFDMTQTQIEEMVEAENAEFDRNGQLVKSFDDSDIAKMCGLTKEDIEKL